MRELTALVDEPQSLVSYHLRELRRTPDARRAYTRTRRLEPHPLPRRRHRGEVAQLRGAGATFRNDIVVGPGGSQIQLEYPSGNIVGLFQLANG